MPKDDNTQNDEGQKLYPGSIDRYRALRTLRASTPVYESDEAKEQGETNSNYVLLTIAEELAGLAYILDGIRYSARNK